jgi:hypothetical protein
LGTLPPMGEVVAVLGVLAGLVLVCSAALCWLVWRTLRRRNEVSVSHPTRPPLRWLVWPTTCARLHRRLRGSVVLLRAAVPVRRVRRLRRGRDDASVLDVLASELEAHAAALDGELVVVARARGVMGMAGRQQAANRVAELERSALRVAAEARGCGLAGSDSIDAALRRISDDLDARDAAWEELSRLERDAGLRPTA